MAHQITSSPSQHTIYYDIDVSVDMIQEMEQNQKGEEQGTQRGTPLSEGVAPPTPPLVILLQVTTPRGEPLTVNTFTGQSVANFVHGCSGINPVEVKVMTPQDAIMEVEPGRHVGEITQALHGTHEWEGQAVEISCLLSTCRSVLNIVCKCKARHTWLFQLEEVQQRVHHEQQRQQRMMEQFLWQFQDEVRKVEELQNVNLMIGTMYRNYHRSALIVIFIFPGLLLKILRPSS